MIMDLKHFLKNNYALIIPFLVIQLFCMVVLIFYSKTDVSLYINKFNSPFLDFFFKYMTLFGTFTLIFPIIILLAFVRYRFALIAASSSVLAVILTQVLKRLVFYDSPRPSVFFKGVQNFHFVEDVQLLTRHSFPSGHSSGAFALFIVLALINRNPLGKLLFLMVAVLVGYSRLYLSQHFLTDVVTGSLIGTFSAFVCYFWMFKFKNKTEIFLDKSILSSLKAAKH